jgi:NAD(P)H-dependent FMN reductase
MKSFPDVARLINAIRGSDGFIWASPEYHGSFSGAFKNALDLATIDDHSGKVVALLGVAAGQIGAVQTLGHLRRRRAPLHLWSLPQQVSIAARVCSLR